MLIHSPFVQMLGDQFIEFAPYFKMYTQYVNNHDGIAVVMLLRGLCVAQLISSLRLFACFESCYHHNRGSNRAEDSVNPAVSSALLGVIAHCW